MKLSVLITKESQLKADFSGKISRVYLESDAVSFDRFQSIAERFRGQNIEVFLALPRIMTPQAVGYLERAKESVKNAGFTGFLVRSLESLGYLQKADISGFFVSDYGLYAFNSESRKVLYDFGFSQVTIPLELNEKEIYDVRFSGDELVVYGRYPMMITRNCIHKTLEGCDKQGVNRILTDRMKNRLPVENHCAFCLNIIYNGVVTNLVTKAEGISKLPVDYLRMEFTDESQQEVEDTVNTFYETMILGKTPKKPEKPYTNGHFNRGVD